MLMKQTQFTVYTRARADVDEQTRTNVTLTESDVSDEMIANTLIGGSSPRVNQQSNWRRNGIPANVTMTWSEWLGKPKSVAQPETPESIALRAQSDPVFLARMRDMLEQLNKANPTE